MTIPNTDRQALPDGGLSKNEAGRRRGLTELSKFAEEKRAEAKSRRGRVVNETTWRTVVLSISLRNALPLRR
jgi:hypothetical protein